MVVFAINFLLTGMYIAITYAPVSKCFFKSCITGEIEARPEYYDSLVMKILFGANVAALVILKYLFLKHIKTYQLKTNGERITASAYTVYVKNIKDIKEGRKLATFFESVVPNVKVVKINFIYNISELYEAINKLVRLENKIIILEHKKLTRLVRYRYYLRRREEMKKKYHELQEECLLNGLNNRLFTGKAFVTFEYQSQVEDVLKKLQYKIGDITIQKSKYTVTAASEPQEVIWENFGLTKRQYFLRKAVSFAVTLILIAISFIVIFVIKDQQELIEVTRLTKLENYAISLSIAIVITLINFLFRLAIIRFTFWEKRHTHTNMYQSLVLKISVIYFVNTVLIIFIINMLNQFRVWTSDGFLGNMFVIQIVSIFSSSVYGMLNPFYIYRRLKRWKYLKIIRRSYRTNTILQYDLNNTFEGQVFNIAERYYILFKLVSIVFFVQTMMPYLLLFGVVELTLTYWTHKYVLIKRAIRPKDVDFSFSVSMTKGFDVCIIVMTVGYFVFQLVLTKKVSTFGIVMMVASTVAYFMSEGLSRIGFFKVQHEVKTKNHYDEMCKSFTYDYDRLNPITQARALEQWIDVITENSPDQMVRLFDAKAMAQDIDAKALTVISKYVGNKRRQGFLANKVSMMQTPVEQHSHSYIAESEANMHDNVNTYKVAELAFLHQNTSRFNRATTAKTRRLGSTVGDKSKRGSMNYATDNSELNKAEKINRKYAGLMKSALLDTYSKSRLLENSIIHSRINRTVKDSSEARPVNLTEDGGLEVKEMRNTANSIEKSILVEDDVSLNDRRSCDTFSFSAINLDNTTENPATDEEAANRYISNCIGEFIADKHNNR